MCLGGLQAGMRVIVPFDASTPKTSLADVLTPQERQAFARASLADVREALTAAGYEPTVLSTAPLDFDGAVRVDDRALTPAVNAQLKDQPVAIVMADLALATPTAIERLFAPDADVVFAPGRGGGTNAVVVRHPAFRVDYHGVSIRDHREIAAEVGASVAEVDSYRLSTDIDTVEDLGEVLLHTDGAAATWLREHGFSVQAEDGATVVRS